MTCSRQVITYVHVPGVELGLTSLSDNLVHVLGFGRENLNIFGVNTMFRVEALFCYCQYYWLSEAVVPLVFFQPRPNAGPQPVQCNMSHTPKEHCKHPQSRVPDHP